MIGHSLRCCIEAGRIDGGPILRPPIRRTQMAIGAGGNHGLRLCDRLLVQWVMGLEIRIGFAERGKFTKATQKRCNLTICVDRTVDEGDQSVPDLGQQRRIARTRMHDRRGRQNPRQAAHGLSPRRTCFRIECVEYAAYGFLHILQQQLFHVCLHRARMVIRITVRMGLRKGTQTSDQVEHSLRIPTND